MKILHVCQFLGIGGLEKVLYLLIQEQLAFGHEVSLVVYDWEKTWVKKFKKLNITVYDSYTKNDGYDIDLIKYLNKIIKPFDILHTHDLNPMLYVGVLKYLHLFQLKKFPKIIHTTHGMEHIKTVPKTRLYEIFLAFSSDAIVGVSPAICEYYAKRTTASKNKIFNIDNGTPVAKKLESKTNSEVKSGLFKKYGIDESLPTFVYVARVVPLKDQLLLIEVFSKQKDKQLILVGPSGNEDYWGKVYSNKHENIFILGAQENISEILSCCDVYISASHHEGIPISVLEASAAGLPCILTNIPGHKTLTKFTDKEVAIFFEVGNIESLNIAIKQIENKTLQKNIKENLHKVVYAHYSSQRMFKDYNNIYESLIC